MAGGGLSPKQEHFCRLFLELGEATAAYDQSHPSKKGRKHESAKETACRLLKRPEIQARIAELRGEAADKTTDTLQSMAEQLDEDRRFARENKKPSAAVSATVAKAKLLGFYVEKKDIQVGMRPEEARVILSALTERFAKSSR